MTPPGRRRRLGARAGGRGSSRAASRITAPSFGRAVAPDTPRVCYVHIGLMKSGTTFLQQMASHHREALGKDGLLFPGRGNYVNQINAVRDLLDMPGVVPPARLEGAWDHIRQEISEWSGPASLISVEQLSIATARQIPEIVESLAPATVEVVLTARDLARVLPSTWQENIQNGLTWTWPEFLASVRALPGADPKAGARFWRQHDLVRIANRWSDVVGPERVHLVTLPPPGAPRDLLWQRFCNVTGLDAERYPMEGAELRSNLGLDRASAEMLRRVNTMLGDGVNRATKLRILKRGLAKSVLADLGQQLPIVLDADEYAWATRYSERLADELAAAQIGVVGDLGELVPPDRPTVPTDLLREPTETEIAEVAAAAAGVLLKQLQTSHDGAGPRRSAEAEYRRTHPAPT